MRVSHLPTCGGGYALLDLRLPEAGKRTILWSSHDRRNRCDAQIEGHINRFASNDLHGDGSVRHEGNTFVQAQVA